MAKLRRSKQVDEIEPYWADWDDEALLDLRLCDLGLKIKGTILEPRIEQIYLELASRNLRFRPHFWLSNEWFTPDGVPGVAIPFYLAHPRLARLERNQMLEIEGGTHNWCIKILRHEVGHAIDNAYRLRLRRERQKLFGRSSQKYPEFYAPKPYSKSFVLHLDSWYAQSHPDEDFAETFAVWLSPNTDWRGRYSGWPAIKKLEYMENLMHEIAGTSPVVTKKIQIDQLSKLRITLGEHYQRKRERYGRQYPNFYDRDLQRLFSSSPEYSNNKLASEFIRGIRKEVRAVVARWTGEYQYTIDQVLGEVTRRCKDLNLRLAIPEQLAKVDFTVLLTVQTMNYLHSGRHRIAL
ncbi:MAG: putative zinc-binding metallopeptidase [Deltaproteobacteria bacterium]|nr:putative zinc-binding metallopeptidase [Deltaproteobacteria bacterium]